MMDLHYQSVALMRHAKETRQKPDTWLVGRVARMEILRFAYGKFVYQMAHLSSSNGQMETYLGLPFEEDPDLPELRVVLKSGKNTVGAFSIENAR